MEVQVLQGGQFLPPDNDEPRPEGLHQSDILSDIMKGLDPGRYAKKGPDGEPLPMDLVKVSSGLAFEQALEHAFKPASPGSFRPPPIFIPVPGTITIYKGFTGPGGIWCSIDNLDPDCLAGELVVREFKLTWYSKSKPVPYDKVYWPYLQQLKIYDKAVGTRYNILTVMHINGDYKPPTPSDPDNYGIIFTEREVDEGFGVYVNHAKLRGWLVDGSL